MTETAIRDDCCTRGAAGAGSEARSSPSGDDAYDAARRVWNGVIDRRPAPVIRCTGTADVIAAIAFAREQGLPVSVRGGGHNVAGTAVAEGGVVIDLSGHEERLASTSIGATVRAGGGARLGDVDHETQAFGLATPFGVVSRTGIAGLTLARRHGLPDPRLGLSCDNLVGADVVTADGRLAARGRRAATPTCSGRCAAAAATSASSPRSSTACTRSARRSSWR